MKNQLRRLKALEKMIDLNKFYNVTVYADKIVLQGHFNSSLVVALRARRFSGAKIDDSGYVEMVRWGVEVTLT